MKQPSSPSLPLHCLRVGLRPSFSPGACSGSLGTFSSPSAPQSPVLQGDPRSLNSGVCAREILPPSALLPLNHMDYFHSVFCLVFLQTNSKAFTAKTSCVRRRYREFVWLRRQLQKNAGLV